LIKSLLARISKSPISVVGVLVTTISVIIFLTLFAIELVGYSGGPYVGIMVYLVVPAFFVAGLLLIPFGLWHARRKARVAAEAGEAPASESFPVIDLNHVRVRKAILLFTGLTIINVVIIATATYKGVEVMESTRFCGTVCHSVMTPEYTSYQRSPHARVKCVDCHIGSGASWFVKSKLSGSWQIASVMFNLYDRPIPTPVHNLRPARETCEQCHWPAKFVGDRLKVITKFDDDEQNTEKKTALLMHVGGTMGSTSQGIHWHVDRGVHVSFVSDEKRDTIGDVNLTLPDGTHRIYKSSATLPKTATLTRNMECVDCHNRPSHIYRLPDQEVDDAILSGHIDRTLPYIRREAVKALKAPYATREEAQGKIRQALQGFYLASYPEIARTKAQSIDAAVRSAQSIYLANVWPSMRITWGAYPSFIGHTATNGCFRCHDDEHKTADGRTISGDCALCHSVLAEDEADPKILRDMIQH
jgi:nitrate/TMAO reductase-like tetraheme cytochrome c subunit